MLVKTEAYLMFSMTEYSERDIIKMRFEMILDPRKSTEREALRSWVDESSRGNPKPVSCYLDFPDSWMDRAKKAELEVVELKNKLRALCK